MKKLIIKSIEITLLLILLLAFYTLVIEPNILRVYEKTVYLPNFNEEHNGLKIAVMSDFHFIKYGINEKKLQKIVCKTNLKTPDFIFLLGDFDVHSILKNNMDINAISRDFSHFKSKYGVYAVLGNHDYNKDKTVNKMLKKANIILLEDDISTININGKPIRIYGLKDLWHFDYNKNLITPDNKCSSIVLSHNPDVFPLVPDFVSVVLSGHTHGGQFYIPPFGGIFCSSIYKQRFLKGYIVENNKHLFVSSGLGNWVPARLGNVPEVVILNLYSQNTFPQKTVINTKKRTGISKIDMRKLYYLWNVRKNLKKL